MDEDQLSLRPPAPSRYDERCPNGGDLDFIMKQIAQLPTRRDLARLGLVILFVGAVLGIIGVEASWRYFPCSPV